MTVSAILLMAGQSTRFASSTNKNLTELFHKPLFFYSLETFLSIEPIDAIYLVVKKEEKEEVENLVKQNFSFSKITLVEGGKTRADSVCRALKLVTTDVVLVHDSARPYVLRKDILSLLDIPEDRICGSLYHALTDTVKQKQTSEIISLKRDQLLAVTTPQIFKKVCYEKILTNSNKEITDELSLFNQEKDFYFVKETSFNGKVTYPCDMDYFELIKKEEPTYRIGHSFDFHPLVKNRPLILGGVKINYSYGLDGHSDADSLYHSLTEAIFGALSMKDMGTYFPDHDPQYLNMDSTYFVRYAMKEMEQRGYHVENIDIMIYLEKPKLKDYMDQIIQNIKTLTHCEFISVKATTLEKKGMIGLGEGIAAETMCLLKK
jgi:2-C-methyl-D-erythritol 4-phosphate cytidylyltransferase/2-C-methyl-D-erythritol 2,4-cyclodiphosphate synthase